MSEISSDTPNVRAPTRRRRDSGSTFIEVLVSIVLLGTVVVATLAALRTTVIGTAIERDHARAHEWLQSASEILINDITYVDCDTNSATEIKDAYQSALRSTPSIIPNEWNAPQITVLSPVTFGQPSGLYSATCAGDVDRQLVTLEVTDTDGDIVEQVDVVVVP
jgi:hypothetical protein